MRATVGDQLRVRGRTVGSGERYGEIVEVRGEQGNPPYVVRFGEDDERLMFPGSDCQVETPAK